jgi:hypothetical protein
MSGPTPVRDLEAQPALGRIDLTWKAKSYTPLVDHFAVHASTDPRFRPGAENLLGKTVYARLRHDNLGPAKQTRYYRVVTVDAAGERSRPSELLRASSVESVTIGGRPVAVIGTFDRKSLELALAPGGYNQFLTRFPNGVDYTHGVSAAATDWAYLHPGPADKWAGSKAHTFTLRFGLDAVPAKDLALAVWLIDTHATIPGRLVVACNGNAVTEAVLEKGATKGSTQGDATVPGTPLRPSIVEVPLPRGALVAGQNVLTFAKPEGSWHAYDAVGVFEPRS